MPTYNEAKLAWLRDQGSTSNNIMDAEVEYAVSQGFTNWSSIGGKNADEPPLPVQGNSGVSESGQQVRIVFDINVTATLSEEHQGWDLWIGNTNIGFASGFVLNRDLVLVPKAGYVIKKSDRPVLVYYNASTGSLRGADAPNLNVVSIWGLEIPNGSQQGVLGDGFAAGFDEGFD